MSESGLQEGWNLLVRQDGTVLHILMCAGRLRDVIASGRARWPAVCLLCGKDHRYEAPERG